MSSDEQNSRRRNLRRDNPYAVKKFLEELSWLLSAYSDLDFKILQEVSFDKVSSANKNTVSKNLSRKSGSELSSASLVGILPGLFVDENIFATNEDIVEFASSALNINIPRWYKKSKYEIIGHIVCNTNLLDGDELSMLMQALLKLRKLDDATRDIIRSRKSYGQSWNETIQQLLDLP